MATAVNVTASTFDFIDGLLHGTRWSSKGDSTTVSFGFPTSAKAYEVDYSSQDQPRNGFGALNANQQAASRSVFDMYASVANLTFAERTGATAAGADNPYANPDAPYKVEQSASGKLTEPLVNTPRTVTVTPKEVIEDKSARDLRDLARSTPGLTIGSAEGGNSYGAFAIRGFKASNDIFVDSIRNPGNVIPEVFSVQQVEIYKGASAAA